MKQSIKKILDFVNSYIECITDGEYRLDEANREQLKYDIQQLLQDQKTKLHPRGEIIYPEKLKVKKKGK